MNKIIAIGRLTKDPELKTSTTGTSVLSFNVAVNRNFKNKEGKYDADFLPCVAYRNTADFISKYFKKGSLICVDGRVQTRTYDAQDGTKRYVTEIVVENAEFVGSKSENSMSNGDSGYFPDAPSNDMNQVDAAKEIDIVDSDPYEKYDNNDNNIVLSDNDLPF